jgi:hypothetical protein
LKAGIPPRSAGILIEMRGCIAALLETQGGLVFYMKAGITARSAMDC